MNKQTKNVFTAAMFLAACSLTACSSNDEPQNNNQDNEAPQLSEFRAKAENRIWTPSSQEDITWITTDGQVLTAEDLTPVSGSTYQRSYHFSGSEAVIFDFLLFGPGADRALKCNYTFELNESKSVITFNTQENNAEAFSIELESISADRMVIHDSDRMESDKGEIAYRRVVLVPVDKDEEQTWWDAYAQL